MEQFLNLVTDIFKQLKFDQTTYFLQQERKDIFSDDLSILDALTDYLVQIQGNDSSIFSQNKPSQSQKQLFHSPKSSFSENRNSSSMLYSTKTQVPMSKNFRSYRQKNPFGMPSDTRSIENEKFDVPIFGEDAERIKRAKDLAKKRASNQGFISNYTADNELNFSFKEDSIHEDQTQNSNVILNTSFGDKNNVFEDDAQNDPLNNSFGQGFPNILDKESKQSKVTNFDIYETTSSFEVYLVDYNDMGKLKQHLIQNNQFFNQISKNQKLFGEKENSLNVSKIKLQLDKYFSKNVLDLQVYIQQPHSSLAQKYTLQQKFAESTFSIIHTCQNIETKKKYAVKIIKDKKLYLDQSLLECAILRYINQKNQKQKTNILELTDIFYQNNQLHLVTELLGNSLYQAFIKPKFPLSITSIQVIAKDILTSLYFLKHIGIIHCDLKPENILLIKNESNHVKLIDLGSAIFVTQNNQHYEMQTCPYRAPEIILLADYSYAIDMWSLGCILYELITHKPLFDYNDPRKNLVKALSINKTLDLTVFNNIKNDHFFIDSLPTLQKNQIADENEELVIIPKFDYDFDSLLLMKCKEPLLVDLIKKCLILDPAQRITPKDALNHNFFKKKY